MKIAGIGVHKKVLMAVDLLFHCCHENLPALESTPSGRAQNQCGESQVPLSGRYTQNPVPEILSEIEMLRQLGMVGCFTA